MRVAPKVDGYDIVDVIAELEGQIETLVRWARAVRDLGGCCHDVSADGLAVIGAAMLGDAIAAKVGWRRCFDLACDLGARTKSRRPSSLRQGGGSYPAPGSPEEAR